MQFGRHNRACVQVDRMLRLVSEMGRSAGLSHLKLPEPGYELDEVIVIPSSALELAAH